MILRAQNSYFTALEQHGTSVGSIAPYLRLSPRRLPVSIFVKGAVLNEYADYGYGLGGRGQPFTTTGFTVGATVGF